MRKEPLAEETAKALDQLVHDARGPLNTISMNAELAKLLIHKEDSREKIESLMQTIVTQCKECNAVLEQYRQQQRTAGGEHSDD